MDVNDTLVAFRGTMRNIFSTFGIVLLWSTRIALAQTTSVCMPDGLQSTGAVYRICMPNPSSAWNGQLVVFAHGYVVSTAPIAIPEDQLGLPGDATSLPGLVNSLGYAFAVSSFRTNGLAVLPAIDDLRDLVDVFHRVVGPTSRIYITGASEGGLITTLSMERYPQIYNAGLAACGPIGDFPGQINYLGDFRVIFDNYFPGVVPGNPVVIQPDLMANWTSVYTPAVTWAVAGNPSAAQQVLHVTWAPGDNPTDTQSTFQDALWYNVFTTNDAVQKLGGNPYDNHTRWYFGSQNDLDLNSKVQRITASPTALANMQAYQTTGKLKRPLVTIHTTEDQIVPYWHELAYGLKALFAGSGAELLSIPVTRYGHCNFQASDVLLGFALMVLKDLGQPMSASVANVLPPGQQADFHSRAARLNAIR